MKTHCDKCNEKLSYHERYDAYYCKMCNQWTESQCKDDSCSYCVKRPINPIKEGDYDN